MNLEMEKAQDVADKAWRKFCNAAVYEMVDEAKEWFIKNLIIEAYSIGYENGFYGEQDLEKRAQEELAQH